MIDGPRPEIAAHVASRYPGCRIEPMAGDASTRRFHRLRLAGGGSRVVMDYGDPFEGETDDVRLTRIFLRAKLPVARVLEVLPDVGCLVLEDLGETTLERALEARGGDPEALYRRAVDLAVAVAVRGTPALAASARAAGPRLDARRFRFEMDFFTEHFVGGLAGRVPPAGLRRRLHALADLAAEGPAPVLCHRDYHSRNLVVAPDGSLAMTDIQDARWGPDTYDLASLLRDAYAEPDESLVARLIEAYRGALPGTPERAAFCRRFEVVAAQRMIKALGTFGYQVAELGREGYRGAAERTLARLDRLLPAAGDTADIHASFTQAGLFEALGRPGPA